MTADLPRPADYHRERTGAEPSAVASAPGTWALLGEHTEGFGGTAILGLIQERVTVAISPRGDDVVAVHALAPGTTGTGGTSETTDTITLGELDRLAATQQPTVDDAGQPVTPPDPEGGLAAGLGGVIWTLRHRQLLGRDATGFDITVTSALSTNEGLGAEDAAEAALALAIGIESSDLDDAPLRAKLAEIASQASAVFSRRPPQRSRHTAALRGTPEKLAVIDYSDESVTQASPLAGKDLDAILLAPTATDADESPEVRRRQRFVAAATHAFGTNCLRLLPDAVDRVGDWLGAVHEVYGPEAGQPGLDEAAGWLQFWEREADRAESLANVLRSHRGRSAATALIGASAAELATLYGLRGVARHVTELATARGALAARPAAAGTSAAAVALVEKRHTPNFLADLHSDGLHTRLLHPGEPARLEV